MKKNIETTDITVSKSDEEVVTLRSSLAIAQDEIARIEVMRSNLALWGVMQVREHAIIVDRWQLANEEIAVLRAEIAALHVERDVLRSNLDITVSKSLSKLFKAIDIIYRSRHNECGRNSVVSSMRTLVAYHSPVGNLNKETTKPRTKDKSSEDEPELSKVMCKK